MFRGAAPRRIQNGRPGPGPSHGDGPASLGCAAAGAGGSLGGAESQLLSGAERTGPPADSDEAQAGVARGPAGPRGSLSLSRRRAARCPSLCPSPSPPNHMPQAGGPRWAGDVSVKTPAGSRDTPQADKDPAGPS